VLARLPIMTATRHDEPALSGIARRRSSAKVESSPEYLLRRKHIVEAAARVFRAKGYSRATLTDIAEEARTDRANIYYYVANKRELFLAALQHYLDFESVAKLAEINRTASASDRLRILIIGVMRHFEENYPFAYLATQENLAFLANEEGTEEVLKEVERVNELGFGAIQRALREGIRNGEFSSTVSSGVLAEAVAGVLTWSSHWYDPATSRYTSNELGVAFADLVLQGLMKEPARRSRSHSKKG